MRHTLRTIIAAGGLAALSLCPASIGCDKDKASQPASTQPAYIVSSPCAKMRATQVAATDNPACTGARPTTAAAESAVVTEQTLKLLVQALGSMKSCCGGQCPAGTQVAAAVRTIVESRPDLCCETVTAALAGTSSCRSSGNATPAVLAVSGSGSASCAGKAQAAAQNVASTSAKSCDPSACQKAKAAAMTAAAGETPACHGAAKARYVAFNCEKTDRVARAVARAYLDVIRELKLSTGAEGCSAEAASQVLAAVLADMQAERTATAAAEAQPAVVETSTVSFGAVAETAKPECGSTGN